MAGQELLTWLFHRKHLLSADAQECACRSEQVAYSPSVNPGSEVSAGTQGCLGQPVLRGPRPFTAPSGNAGIAKSHCCSFGCCQSGILRCLLSVLMGKATAILDMC